MNISLITPAPAYSRKGNRVTARRWAGILRGLGHRVAVEEDYRGRRCDLLIALHARRSHASIARFRRDHPALPLILALTGTDLYGDIHTDAQAQHSLELASHFVLLQPDGIGQLPERLHPKARVIFQSATRPPGVFTPRRGAFEMCVVGHLRAVKDPFRAAMAARLLPPTSRIQVLQLGAALDDDVEPRACAEMAANPRYHWLGELPRWKALRMLARSRLLVLTSLLEGGANVVTEALACGVPVISSRISGSIGILGPDYPGYFPVGDTAALAALLSRAETDESFYAMLVDRCRQLAPLASPERERQSWADLLRELADNG